MADLFERIEYLSQTVGPRPAGTEEEQQAALYITESLREDAGLPAVIEDFRCNPDHDLIRAVLSGVSLLCGLLSVFVPMLFIPLLIVSLASAALFVLESLGKSVIGRYFAKGASQNVVAKYEPLLPEGSSSRRRKIIVVAHYDSGKVQPELSPLGIKILPILQWVALGAVVAVPLLILIQMGTAGDAGSPLAVRVVAVVASIAAAIPLALMVLHRVSPYSEGANCNAAGVSVMMEAASIIARGGAVPYETGNDRPLIHDAAEAYAAGVVPEGADLSYEAAPTENPSSAEDRLLSAKAAIAALTGRPVSDGVSVEFDDVADGEERAATEHAPNEGIDQNEAAASVEGESSEDNPADSNYAKAADGAGAEGSAQVDGAVAAAVAAPSIFASAQPASEASVPDWFKSAQEKAKRNAAPREVEVQRSKFAIALEAAEKESQAREEDKEAVLSETEQRLARMRESIMEVKAPAFSSVKEQAPAAEDGPKETESPIVSVDETMSAQEAGEEPQKDEGSNAGALEQAPAAENPPIPSSVDESITYRAPRRALSETLPVPDVAAAEEEAARAAAEKRAQASQLSAVIPSIQAGGAESVLDSSTLPDPRQKPQRRRSIDLPAIDQSDVELAPIEELTKQHAPLAEPRAEKAARNTALRAAVPSIDVASEAAGRNARSSENLRSLRETLPTRSGILSPAALAEEPKDEPTVENVDVAVAGSFAVAGATGAFAPVGDELIEDVAPEDVYIEDADDSDYETSITESGAFSGPGYVEMPKSRMSRIFGRFRHNRQDEEEVSPQQWLDVDEGFDARSVGRARGGWESFQQPEADGYEEVAADGYETDDDGWGSSAPDATIRFDASYDAAFEEQDDFGYEDRPRRHTRSSRRYEGGSFSRDQLDDGLSGSDGYLDDDGTVAFDAVSGRNLPLDGLAPVPEEAYDHIRSFSAPAVNTEVWFVALGSELAGNGGMKAFIAEHSSELRGAIVVDVEGLGAGTLSLIEKEGLYLAKSSSSRMKRLVRKASQALGFNVASGTELWKDSAACCAMRHGIQALHIAGMEADKPAYCGQKNDTVDNLSEEALRANTEFLVELIAGI